LAEYWYNTSFHSSLGKTPFLVLYGHDPKHFGIDISQACQSIDLQGWLEERTLMQSLVRQHLVRAQNKMKTQADKRRTPRTFSPGDSVYLKAQPYVQTSLAQRSSNKLAFCFFGPFLVTEKIEQSAYRLQLPPDCLIHPVFHVSQLKKAISPATVVSPELPDISNQFQVPQEILGRRLRQHNEMMTPQVLVRWSHLPDALSTWEDEEQLRQQFPRAPAWGQAGSRGRGDVTDGSHSDETEDEVVEPEEGRMKKDVGVESGLTRTRRPSSKAYGPDWIN
jgi:hypothetical protein